MWIAYAFGPALFAGLTSILAKCGIKQTDSNAATALRTILTILLALIFFQEGISLTKGVAIVGGTLLMLV